MNDMNNVQSAALASGATLAGAGFARFRLANGRPRRAAVAQAARQARAQRRLEAAVDQRQKQAESKVRPAAKVVREANRAAASVAAMPPVAKLDVGTLEELLAGLFSLRSDLTTLADELAAMRDRAA